MFPNVIFNVYYEILQNYTQVKLFNSSYIS